LETSLVRIQHTKSMVLLWRASLRPDMDMPKIRTRFARGPLTIRENNHRLYWNISVRDLPCVERDG